MGKVLIAAAVFNGRSHAIKEYLAALSKLKGKFDVLLVDHSGKKTYAEWLSSQTIFKIKVMHQDFPSSSDILARRFACHTIIRDYALEKKYDSLLLLEQDVILPEDALEKLIAAKKEVIGGVSYSVFLFGKELVKMPKVYGFYTEEDQRTLIADKENLRRINPKLFEALDQNKWDFTDVKRPLSVEDVQGNGVLAIKSSSFDCLLISRKTLAKVPFAGTDGVSDDVRFFIDLKKESIACYVHKDVQCLRRVPQELLEQAKTLAGAQ